jgi:hypothetical protein
MKLIVVWMRFGKSARMTDRPRHVSSGRSITYFRKSRVIAGSGVLLPTPNRTECRYFDDLGVFVAARSCRSARRLTRAAPRPELAKAFNISASRCVDVIIGDAEGAAARPCA